MLVRQPSLLPRSATRPMMPADERFLQGPCLHQFQVWRGELLQPLKIVLCPRQIRRGRSSITGWQRQQTKIRVDLGRSKHTPRLDPVESKKAKRTKPVKPPARPKGAKPAKPVASKSPCHRVKPKATLSMTRKCVCSRVFHDEERRAQSEGCSEKLLKARRQVAFQEAGRQWYEEHRT